MAGVAQALILLGQVLREQGIAQVAVEDPGSLGTRQQLQSWWLSTPPIPVDGGGLRVDELAACGAPAVLLTPAHQFPPAWCSTAGGGASCCGGPARAG